jgi:hypothetical protein
MFANDAPLAMPVTADAPDDEIGSIRFCDTVTADVVELLVPRLIAVIAPPPVTFVIELDPTSVFAPLKLTSNTVIALVPPAMLLNVLFVIVFVGPLVEDAPSVLLQPASVVAPVNVTFEKLFRLFVIAEPVTEDAFAPKNVTVPPAPPLLNAVTIELLFTFSTPVAGRLPERVMNVTLPAVFTLRFVNVLLLMFDVPEPMSLYVM